MALMKGCPIPVSELDFHDRLIWDDQFSKLNDFQAFSAKTMAACIQLLRENNLKSFDVATVSAEDLIRSYLGAK